MATERRRSQRIELSEAGAISWQSETGDTFGERVKVLNLADTGAMIEASVKLPLRQTIQLRVDSWRIDSAATVRYCRQKGLKYRIGLEMFHPIAAKPKQSRWT